MVATLRFSVLTFCTMVFIGCRQCDLYTSQTPLCYKLTTSTCRCDLYTFCLNSSIARLPNKHQSHAVPTCRSCGWRHCLLQPMLHFRHRCLEYFEAEPQFPLANHLLGTNNTRHNQAHNETWGKKALGDPVPQPPLANGLSDPELPFCPKNSTSGAIAIRCTA